MVEIETIRYRSAGVQYAHRESAWSIRRVGASQETKNDNSDPISHMYIVTRALEDLFDRKLLVQL